MAAIKLTQFGGEIPRVPPRSLPPQAATINRNLLATADEFRPLLNDSVVASAPVGTKTLYRTARDSSGALRANDTTGWIAETADKNYVKGQLNDDNTERTYVSFNEGTAAMRTIDATGQDRVLGVTPPTGLVAVKVEKTQFTLADATLWADGKLLPDLMKAITDGVVYSDPASRFSGGVSVAGPRALYGGALPTGQRGISENWNLMYSFSNSSAATSGLDDPQLGGITVGGNHILAIMSLPMWATLPNSTSLKSRIRALLSPKDGSQLFTDTNIDKMAVNILERYDTNGAEIARKRDDLDEAVKEFKAGIDALISAFVANPSSRPVAPQQQYDTNGNQTAAWTAYQVALDAYNEGEYRERTSANTVVEDKTSRIAKMVAAQAKARKITKEIEDLYIARRDGLEAWVKTQISNTGIGKTDSNPDGLVKLDADRIIDSRFYIATFVTDWGEESAPSMLNLATDLLEVDQNDEVIVTVSGPTGPNAANVKRWRLYRSNSGTNTAGFQFVDEMLIQTLAYTDKLKGSQLGEICPTITWAEPPVRRDNTSTASIKPIKGSDPYLRGLVGMPNGIMAGFMDNFVAFCEPYIPYAWPVEYQITTEFPIVGLGVFGQSLFVGTIANPYIISGSDSASMSAQKLDVAQACASRRSIVSAQGGVFYASPDGICFASPNGVQLLTESLFSREDWQALQPKTIVASSFEGVYYFWYGGNGGGSYALDTNAKKLVRVDMAATAVFPDSITDAVFYVQGGQIKRAFSTSRRVGVWRSGIAVMPKQTGFAWLQVDGDLSPAAPVTIRWYGDGGLVYTVMLTSKTPVRLPVGVYLEHQIEVESTARITKVVMASSTEELQAI